jgi:signal recognition particle subunit SRP54
MGDKTNMELDIEHHDWVCGMGNYKKWSNSEIKFDYKSYIFRDKEITEEDLKAPLREVRMALLEADVNFKVVKNFVAKIKERALGAEIQQNLSPSQQIIKIVDEELTELLGGTQAKLTVADKPPTIIMLVGLQGTGKTTTVGKLAFNLKKKKKNPLLVAADVYRPAAITQLQVLGEQVGVPVFSLGNEVSPVEIARQSLEKAAHLACDTIIIDTAGRLHIDEKLMEELQNIKATVQPHEILLTVDAMTGQDAVTVADTFNKDLGLTGLVVTKLDGDARGGAVLSVREVTGCPVKFVGMGEKLDALEPFYPDRMASRILGMGDILSLIDKIKDTTDLAKALEMEKKLKKDEFTLEQFLEQMQQIKKLGSLDTILGMIPGMGGISQKLKEANVDEKEFARVEAIIRSMTPKERQKPEIINGSRRKRIAAGCGMKVQDVNRLLKNFDDSKKLMKKMQGMAKFASKGGKMLPFMHK